MILQTTSFISWTCLKSVTTVLINQNFYNTRKERVLDQPLLHVFLHWWRRSGPSGRPHTEVRKEDYVLFIPTLWLANFPSIIILLTPHKLSTSQQPELNLKIMTVCSCKMLLSIYKFAQYYKPDNQHLHFHTNLKFQKNLIFILLLFRDMINCHNNSNEGNLPFKNVPHNS